MTRCCDDVDTMARNAMTRCYDRVLVMVRSRRCDGMMTMKRWSIAPLLLRNAPSISHHCTIALSIFAHALFGRKWHQMYIFIRHTNVNIPKNVSNALYFFCLDIDLRECGDSYHGRGDIICIIEWLYFNDSVLDALILKSRQRTF